MTPIKSQLPHLQAGSKIGITSTARKITKEELQPFLNWLEAEKWVPVFSDSLFQEDHQFAGTDSERLNGLQGLLDRTDLDAIWFARGGYGTVRILDQLNFKGFQENPKWLIGYSDMTALHLESFRLTEIPSLHATMAVSIRSNSEECLDQTAQVLKGYSYNYSWNSHGLNVEGKAKGVLVGGNLSMVYSLLGSATAKDWKGKILFLEDLDEYLYHIDRMMMNLKRNGILESISGLVIGGMTDMNDNAIPFGKTAEEIISYHTRDLGIPVGFGLSAGHLDHNLPLILGKTHILEVNQNNSRLHPQDYGVSQQSR